MPLTTRQQQSGYSFEDKLRKQCVFGYKTNSYVVWLLDFISYFYRDLSTNHFLFRGWAPWYILGKDLHLEWTHSPCLICLTICEGFAFGMNSLTISKCLTIYEAFKKWHSCNSKTHKKSLFYFSLYFEGSPTAEDP